MPIKGSQTLPNRKASVASLGGERSEFNVSHNGLKPI